MHVHLPYILTILYNLCKIILYFIIGKLKVKNMFMNTFSNVNLFLYTDHKQNLNCETVKMSLK